MEPIRYLQPAAFPPPTIEELSSIAEAKIRNCSRNFGSKRNTSSVRGQQTTSAHTSQMTYSPHRQHQYFGWCLVAVILLNLLQAIHMTPVFVDNPSLAQFQSGRNIRHLPCIVRKSGLSGVCMFAIDCIKQNGTHLGTCIDRFYFGSCCQIKEENSLFAPEINDNSIDQNTISHFVHESTTLPTSALYKPTTESQKVSENTLASKISTTPSNTTTTTAQSSTHINTHSTKPPKVTTISASSIHTKRPPTLNNTTHKNSQFVVRTTPKPTTTVRTTTHKPSRRKTTTTTTTTSAPPILTTDGPRTPTLPAEDRLQTTASPPKFFTFQIVETTTPNPTEATNFGELSTIATPAFQTKRPHRPTNNSAPLEHKTSAVTIAGTPTTTTLEPTSHKVKPTPPIRTTDKPKPITVTTTTTRKPATTKKPLTKRPSGKPTHRPTTPTTTERVRPVVTNNATERPVVLADELPATIISQEQPINTTSNTEPHTTQPSSAKPKPSSTKHPKPTTSPTASTHKKPTQDTTATVTSKPRPKPTTTTPALSSSSSSVLTTTTLSPPTKPSSTQTTQTTTITFKPGLITWTNEDVEPGANITTGDKWQPPQQEPAQWLPVSTIEPDLLGSYKNDTTSPAESTTSSTKSPSPSSTTTSPPITTSATEKIIVSVSSSVSEAQKNETHVKPIKTTTTTRRPSTPTKPNLSATTSTPVVESTTVENESSMEATTENNWGWGAATTGSTTVVDITEDYNGTATTIVPPVTGLEGLDYKQVCGRRMFPEPRIVGGSNAAFGRWPWQISLRQWRTSTYLHKCGAALLNENWAITAAHCVDNVPPSDLLLRLGEYDLAEEEEPYGYQERRVQIVASHPQFDPRTFEYDLALLRFYEPVVFQPNIIPVCVPNSDEDFIGQTAFVTGWGRLYEDGPLPSVLQEVAVPVINNTICETMYRSAGYIEHIPHIFICAGWKKGGYDSCEGDSGGPMVLQREDDKRFQLGGVISWGIGCAEANQPGVYTRISEFRDWINQILQF